MRFISLFLFPLFLISLLLTGCNGSAAQTPDPTPLAKAAILVNTDQPPAAATSQMLLPTEQITPQLSVPYNPAYTESTPLTDTQKIIEILEDLRQLELDKLTEPGWYLEYYFSEPDPKDKYSRSNLVHVVDHNWNCLEQFTFFYQGGQIVPFTFINAAGNKGGYDDLTGEFISLDYQITHPLKCNLLDTDDPGEISVYITSNSLGSYKRSLEIIAQQPQYNNIKFNAWFTRIDDQEFFVLQQDSNGPTGASTMDPDTKEFQWVSNSIRWEYFELASGRPVRQVEDATLSNGKVLHGVTHDTLIYYPELPADLQAAFDQAVAGLDALSK